MEWDWHRILEDPVDGLAWTVVWLSRRWWGLLGLPLAVALLLLLALPRALRRLRAPRRARVAREAGWQALGWSGVDLALTAGLPLLRLAFPPVRGAAYYLIWGRALLSGAVAAASATVPAAGRDLPPTGRRAFSRLLWAAHGAMAAAIVYATYLEGQRLQVTRTALTFPGRTPDALPLCLRVAQLTDIHVERHARREDKALALLRAARPDLILLTGDYVNIDYYDAQSYEDLRAFLRAIVALAPPLGVYACLGNVDPPGIVRATMLGTGVHLLDETAVTLSVAGRRIQLAGAGSSRGHRWEFDFPRLQRALDAADAQGAPDLRILLFHTPDMVPQAAARGVDLYLCGHTHGGQIRVPVVGALRTGSRFGRRYVMGLHAMPNGGYIYTSRGVGFEGMDLPRVRVLCPPEIPLFDLTIGGTSAPAAAPHPGRALRADEVDPRGCAVPEPAET